MYGLEELIKREVKQVFGNRSYVLRDEILYLQTDDNKTIELNSDEIIVLYLFKIAEKQDSSVIQIENETSLIPLKNEIFINSTELEYLFVCHSNTKIYNNFPQALIKYFRVKIL